MIYNNKQELLEMLRRNGHYLQKQLGQNFLINTHVIDQILAAAQINKNDRIVEVGPGMGILTNELALLAKDVTTIEYDRSILDTLHHNLKAHTNINIINQDALKFPLPDYDYKLVANIPYYITSPLLNHFLNPQAAEDGKEAADGKAIAASKSAPKRPSLIVLLVQKEVAEKICAKTGDHSILSLEVQLFGSPSIETKVAKSSFFPEPKVDSAILKIETYPNPLVEDTKTFFRLIKAAFNQRRKTLHNSLKGGLMLKKEEVDAILKEAGVSSTERPQNLDLESWQKLVEAYKKRAI